MLSLIPKKHKTLGIKSYLYLLRLVHDKGYCHPDQDLHKLLKNRGQVCWLDLGCGENFFVNYHKKNESISIGLDGDKSLVYRAIGHRPNIIADVKNLPFKKSSFDLVSSHMVLEHFEDGLSELMEISKILAGSGRFLSVTVNKEFWGSRLNGLLPDKVKKYILRRLLNQAEDDVYPAHYAINTRTDIHDKMNKVGLRIKKYKEYKEYYHVSVLAYYIQRLLFKIIFPKSKSGVSNILFIAERNSTEQ